MALNSSPTTKKPIKKTAKATDRTGDEGEIISIDKFSLQSIGAYMLFRPIDEESAEDLCQFIIKANYIFPEEQPLTLLINSPGGGVYDGFGIIDLMESSRLQIQTVGIGMVASMASLIFTAGTKGKRIMSRNSFIMTHQFYQGMEGKYHEFIAQRNHDDDIHKRFVEHFQRHTKMSEKQIQDVLLGSSDKWISAKEALKYGMCDEVRDPWS
jgi:ATP-dependent Clp protease protease subunit